MVSAYEVEAREVEQFHQIVRDLLALDLHPSAWPEPRFTRALATRIVAAGIPHAGVYSNGTIIRHDPVKGAEAPRSGVTEKPEGA